MWNNKDDEPCPACGGTGQVTQAWAEHLLDIIRQGTDGPRKAQPQAPGPVNWREFLSGGLCLLLVLAMVWGMVVAWEREGSLREEALQEWRAK